MELCHGQIQVSNETMCNIGTLNVILYIVGWVLLHSQIISMEIITCESCVINDVHRLFIQCVVIFSTNPHSCNVFICMFVKVFRVWYDYINVGDVCKHC